MKLRSLILVLACLFVATFFKFLLNAFEDNGVAWDDPQFSALKAQLRGLYICSVKATPSTFQWNGTTISFREIWIERRVHTDHPYVWLSRTNQSSGDYLCFTINASRSIFSDVSAPFFICDEGDFGGGVGTINHDELFDAWLKPDALTRHTANLRLVKGWNDTNPASINLSW
jgi:hypothetical protein